ncbi:MAG: leucine-rich repeat domain-containing protein [Lachnospiraceae bacterium]|nr:leucine-rich repeat domain-containing protein [uncultured Acetatifactor sp.]MCI8287110.1 leucine-rich repeat domain-containing protein [Lachnospiraceae bacterium]
MAGETQKCPMCSTKLKMIGGRMTCKKCGYYIRSQSEMNDTSSPQYGRSSQYTDSRQSSAAEGSAYRSGTPGQGSSTYRAGSSYQSDTTGRTGSTWQSGQSPTQKKPGESNPVVAIVVSVIAGSISVAALVAIVLFRAGIFDGLITGTGGNSRSESLASSLEDEGNSPSQSEQASQASSSGQTASSARLPQSSFFCEVAEAIWEKPYRSVSAEEYASLTALQIDRDENSIYYQLNYGETQTLTYYNDIGMDLADLASFTGLEWLSLDADLNKGDLDGLNYLYGVYAENTISDLADIIPNPEYITEIGAEDSIFEHDLSGIESFPNLEYLYVDYGSLEDISALLQYPNLLGLTLIDCDSLNDYSPLMSLNSLESLTIDSSQLKSIDFINEMPLLTSLSVENSQISNINALGNCPGLEVLSLIDNYDIVDYSIIGQLSELKDLTLEMSYDSVLPSFENLTQVEWLTVKNASDLTPLKDAVNVTYLSLADCAGWELESITAMQNLNTLIINDFRSYVDSLDPLTRLPNLNALSLEDTSVFGNIEAIFGIPTLQYLYLDDCQVGIDFERMPVNETLEVLSLSEMTILRDPTYNNGDEINLSEHYDMFDCFPNLTELYAASLRLDSIEFVSKLPRLQYLDITNNSVTSLKPLEALSDFQAVWCGQNTILENLSPESDIFVYTSDY